MPSEGLLASEKPCKHPGFTLVFLCFFITLQKCIRKRFATDLGGPNLSFRASFGCPESPMDSNLEAQSFPRTPTWTSKALPDLQVGVQRPFQNPNLEAQSAPRRQLGGPRAHFGGPKRSNTSTWRPQALQRGPSGCENLSSEEQNFDSIRATRSKSIDR